MKKPTPKISSQSLQAKQAYLHQMIILQDYDPEQFQQFMANQKGLDLQDYTIRQLKHVVRQFKGSYIQDSQSQRVFSERDHMERDFQNDEQDFKLEQSDAKNKQSKQQSIRDKKKQQKQLTQPKIQPSMKQQTIQPSFQPIDRSQSISISSSKSFNSSLIKSYIICKKSSISTLYANLSKKPITISVRSFAKKQSTSMFKFGVVMDGKFKEGIISFNGQESMPIPPIPNKTTIRSFEQQHIEERMILFQRFLNKILHVPELCSDPVFQAFLSVSNPSEFKSIRQKGQTKLKNLGDVYSYLKGQDIIRHDQISISSKRRDYYSQSISLMNELNNELKEMQKNIKQASNRAINSTNLFKDLAQLNREFKIKSSGVFDLMGQFVGTIGQKLDNQYYHLKNYVSNIWLYEQRYKQTLISEISLLQKHKLSLSTKSRSFPQTSIDISSAQISKKQLSQYLKSKQLYRLKISILLQQLQRHEQMDLLIGVNEFTCGIEKYVNGIKDDMLKGVDLFTYAQCLKQGKEMMQVEYLAQINHENYRKRISIVKEVLN